MKKLVTLLVAAVLLASNFAFAQGASKCAMCHAAGKPGGDVKAKCSDQAAFVKKLTGQDHKGPKGMTEADAKKAVEEFCK